MAAQLKEEKLKLETAIEQLDEERSKIQNQLQSITQQLEDIELHELSPIYISFLEKRLTRLKQYVEKAT
jgi:chromosome segregation ATPase